MSSGILPGTAPGQSPEGTLPPGGGNTGGGKGGYTPPSGTAPPPQVFVRPNDRFQPVIPDESGGRSQVPSGSSGLFSNLLNTAQTMDSGKPQPSSPPPPPNMFDTAANSIYDAMDATRGAMNYVPMTINPGSYTANTIDPSQFNLGFQSVSAPSMQAAQTSQADIDRFFNPYTDQVVDTSLADIDRARQMQANQAAAQAQAAGAFGGSRGALMEAEIGRNALDQAARTAGDLRRQGFTQAAQLAQQDVGRRQQSGILNAQQALQAALANQRAGLQAGMANQDAALRSLISNQGALNAASQFNINQDQSAQALNQAMGLQGIQNQLAAANQLANLGNLGYNQATGQLAGVNQAGNQQQALLQALLSGANAQTQSIIGQPDMDLQRVLSVLSGMPFGTSQTTSSSPGLLDIAQTGAMIAALLPGSDRRLKDNIQLIGKTEGNHNIYLWTWNELARDIGADRYPPVGVMAQEVRATQPEAVVEDEHGYLRVDYSKVH